MITVEGYNLFYNTDHLLKPKPETYREMVERLIPIECRLFYNVVSSPECRYERKFAEGRIKEEYKNMDAESRFKNIFTEKIIYANPKSFFVNKLNILPSQCEDIKSVSFALADYRELPEHFIARGSEYGICFFHDFLQNRGLRPVEYLNENDTERKKRLVFNSPHLIEIYSPKYDMRWEREWRIGSDLPFTANDIAFVIVPQDKHEYFLDWFAEIEEFEDIRILTSTTFKSYVDHLIFYPQQQDNSWFQIEILRNKYGKGLKISPDELNGINSESKRAFQAEHLEELSCFAKNTILLNYEYGYVNRFLKFREKILNVNALGALFEDYSKIKANLKEPIEAERDLIIGLFESFYLEYGIQLEQ